MRYCRSMNSSKPPLSWRQRLMQRSGRRALAWSMVLAACLAIVWLVYFWTERIAIGKLQASGAQRLKVYISSLENALEKYDFLPKTLELNRDVIRLLQHPEDPVLVDTVNHYLEQMNAQAKSSTIFISNLDGNTRAARTAGAAFMAWARRGWSPVTSLPTASTRMATCWAWRR